MYKCGHVAGVSLGWRLVDDDKGVLMVGGGLWRCWLVGKGGEGGEREIGRIPQGPGGYSPCTWDLGGVALL